LCDDVLAAGSTISGDPQRLEGYTSETAGAVGRMRDAVADAADAIAALNAAWPKDLRSSVPDPTPAIAADLDRLTELNRAPAAFALRHLDTLSLAVDVGLPGRLTDGEWLEELATAWLADPYAPSDELVAAAGRHAWALARAPFHGTGLRGALTRLLAAHPDPAQRALAVRDFFAALDEPTRLAFARAEPALVGNTDGVPVELRYVANRIRVAQALEAALLAQAAVGGAGHDVRVDGRIATYRRLLQEPVRFRDPHTGQPVALQRQILFFSAAADGLVGEVFGDLPQADHVAVVVPGITNRLDNFRGPSGNAEQLFVEANLRTRGARTATIAWLGYDTPEWRDGALGFAAQTWSPALARFAAALPASLHPGKPVTRSVVAHSYGSVLTGTALADHDLAVDRVVVVGSPGMGVRHVDELGLPDGVELYAGRADWDPVSLSEWHGRDPADPTSARHASTPARSATAGASAGTRTTSPATRIRCVTSPCSSPTSRSTCHWPARTSVTPRCSRATRGSATPSTSTRRRSAPPWSGSWSSTPSPATSPRPSPPSPSTS
jgi:hypothetical protein